MENVSLYICDEVLALNMDTFIILVLMNNKVML